MNDKAEFAVKILKQYAQERGEIVRGTTDLSPLEEWLIIQLFKSNRLDLQVMPLLIKDEISQKLIDRLNMFEKQMASDYGFANKQKIAHKIKELKKCIQIVQSA